MKEKYPKAELMAYYRDNNGNVYDSGYKKYYFDKDANITKIYINGSGDTVTNCQFWGMLPDNTNIACYYYKKDDGTFGVFNSLMYENGLIKDKVHFFTGTGIDMDKDLLTKSMDAVLKKTGDGYYDYNNTNTSTTTEANNNWKSKVAGKIIEEKEVENTYTFLNEGDISVRTSKGKAYTLKFWGAESPVDGIYYVKVNLQDIFGNIAPNEETYFYYGYRFEEYSYRLSELREFWQHPIRYCNEFTNWYEKNFNKKGKSIGKIDWANMPLQTTKNIAFWNTQENILLMENKK